MRIFSYILIISSLYFSQITIAGFITDQNTGESLIGANIFVPKSDTGTISDKNGFYSLTIEKIPNSMIEMNIQYLGYNLIIKKIEINNNVINQDFELERSNIELDETEITGEQETRQTATPYSSIKITQAQLSSLPTLAEADIFRTLQSLPGIMQLSEFSTGLVIRGGNTDQNLILLDGITVYNPSHLGGLFSNFIVDAVKEANLTKGGFNAEYGGRLSAVLDVVSREGNRNKFSMKSSISLLSAKTTLEGPFYKGAWLVSGRRTYFDKVFEAVDINVPPYYFYDVQGHIFTDLTYKDRLSISFYEGVDDFEFGDLGLSGDWGNETISLKYRRLFNEKLIGNFLVAKSKFFVNFGLGGESGINENDFIDDISFSGDFAYYLNNNLTIKTGYQYKDLGFSYQTSFDQDTLFSSLNKPKELNVYTQAKFIINDKLILEPGLRINYYDNNDKNFYPNGRFGLKYIINTDEFINLSLGNYNQFMYTFQDDFNPPIIDAWVAIDNSVKAGGAEHFVLGYEKYKNNYKFQIEGYYKNIYNMLTFEDTRASTDGEISSENLSDILFSSNGNAAGLEFFIQKLKGDLTGWLSYTLSYATKEIDGKIYYTNWDRTHVANYLGNYKLSNAPIADFIPFLKKWEFNWKFTYQSGQAYTPILGYYLEDISESPETIWRTIPGGRNSERYPAYHRLDLGMTRDFKIGKKIKGNYFIQVINAYNRKNIFRYIYTTSNIEGRDDDGDWTIDDDYSGDGEPGYYFDGNNLVPEPNVDEPDEYRPQRSEISIFPMIPTIGVTIEF
ncbi:TonB-dependent receptor [Candidatus Marinimicrobia bacterium]|nr:TonB-dependent receptor [Candidatus Neomarinimicrobiota bacterium]|tara:strand:+ start:384 stop:2747 length:2364 start_codon:yes stop_codon:yes gene_type:complete